MTKVGVIDPSKGGAGFGQEYRSHSFKMQDVSKAKPVKT
jgi:hypothetical protein